MYKLYGIFASVLIFNWIYLSIAQLVDYDNFISIGIARENFEKGFKLEGSGEKPNAINYYLISFQASPSADTAYKIGELSLILSQGNFALTWFSQALQLNSSHIPSLLQYGIIKHYQKEEKASIECYNKIINLDRNQYEAWYNLGVSYQHLGEIEVWKILYSRINLFNLYN
jgi:tetratricopeptide (TPR) repeat protein